MSDVILDLAAIKARAEAATLGPWFTTGAPWFRSEDGVLAGSPDCNIAFMIADCESFAASRDEYEGPFKLATAQADAAHIAGMDPPTTLALVAEVERLTRSRGYWPIGLMLVCGRRAFIPVLSRWCGHDD